MARVVAQAKVNLRLRVLAREASGFHQIETIFQRLELGDEVVVRVGGSGRSLDCRGADVGPVEHNLAWRAATAFAEATGWPDTFAIEIDKRIPVGGGLGGGSADAGAVLRCLNALAPRPLHPADLLALAMPLGSDVPFLALDAPLALAWGRGERMLALPPLPRRDVQLVCFDQGVPTPDAYGWLAASRGQYGPVPVTLDARELATWTGIARQAANDFEPIVMAHHPGVREQLPQLRAAAATLSAAAGEPAIALMSGSGATLVLVLPAGDSGPTDGLADGMRRLRTRTVARVAEVHVGE